jgi:DNA polymerase-1
MQYAKDMYGVSYTLEEAEEIRNSYFKAYPAIAGYHNRIKAFLKNQGYVESPLGRRRRLLKIHSDDNSEQADAERKAVNFPIQSFSSDLGLLGMKLFYDAYISNPKLKSKIKLMWFIHDAIFFQAEEDVVEEAIALAKECLSKRTSEYIHKHFGFIVGYPIEAEAKIGDNWANLKEIK